eukprot:CAMPEP_0168380460 /NCGR_PEP_ID=MMETSP0228-20121227/12371_1 /TAXON_ID=133427 /ORGANISM="Protoceratium reticulatum, Strain CCCM 535 (=CCMP 1889)" /LENGTH=202 /DNA_ID=CAMNT_0008393525 /DNA_START=44 /DNA_END=652 /DNA_ORIENTATION=+
MTEKELTKGAKRLLDEDDEYVCGFCSLQLLDQDGYAKKTKGSSIQVPFHLASADGDMVVLEAVFPMSQLFFLQIPGEEGNYLFGRWWIGERWSTNSQICELVVKDCQAIHKSLDGDARGGSTFSADAHMPFLRDCDARPVKVSYATKEQRFVTKVARATLQIPRASWLEWKQYRLKLWRVSKVWGGEDKNDDEKKEEEKKEE